MKKLIILIIIILLGLTAYGYYLRPSWLEFIPWFKTQVLTAEEIASQQKVCSSRFTEAQIITNDIRAKGQRVTEPKVFFSPLERSCLATYFVQDESLPENSTFNSFIIYDLDHNRQLYNKDHESFSNYSKYLEKIKTLEAN
jgi:hypothetical protein